jgi:hypothetical protein
MGRRTDYGHFCAGKYRDGQCPLDVPPGHVAIHDGDVTTYVYDVLGDIPAWRDWARSVFARDDGEIAIVGSGDRYCVERAPVEVTERLAALAEAGDDAGYEAALAAWIKSVEG